MEKIWKIRKNCRKIRKKPKNDGKIQFKNTNEEVEKWQKNEEVEKSPEKYGEVSNVVIFFHEEKFKRSENDMLIMYPKIRIIWWKMFEKWKIRKNDTRKKEKEQEKKIK